MYLTYSSLWLMCVDANLSKGVILYETFKPYNHAYEYNGIAYWL